MTNSNHSQALFAMFPTQESFIQFENELSISKDTTIQSIAEWACQKGLIPSSDRSHILQFIKNQTPPAGKIPERISFSTFINDLTSRLSVNSLVAIINEYAEVFHMPCIQASMITRLKKNFHINTSKKRLVLRLLAFWTGKKNPLLGWNYDNLIHLANDKTEEWDHHREREGVVILFHLECRGGLIEPEAVEWLKSEIPGAIQDLHLKRQIVQRNIEMTGVASLKLRFNKKPGTSQEPGLFAEAVRDAIAVWHQLSVRWLLSRYSTPAKLLKVFIYAGHYDFADQALQPLLPLRLPDDPVLMLTDFAHLCADVADVKGVFQRHDLSRDYDRNQFTSIWTIKYLWVWNYYDYIPALLENQMLPKTRKEAELFRQELYYPASIVEKSFGALKSMDHSPHKILLLLEIAKVLVARRMYNEADQILGYILRIDPLNVVARVGRMMIYSCRAIESGDRDFAQMALQRAIEEGSYIATYGDHNEEVWTELGRTHLKTAVYNIRTCRDSAKSIPLILKSLEQSVNAFTMGMTISASGKDNRCLFYLLFSQALKDTFTTQTGQCLAKQPDTPCVDENSLFTKVAERTFNLVGFTHIEAPDALYEDHDLHKIPSINQRNTMKPVLSALETYLNSILSRTHLANSKFSIAAMLWDFSAVMTVGIYRRILTLLEEAKQEIEELIPHRLAVYSFISEQYLSAEGYIKLLKRTINRLHQLIPPQVLAQPDAEVIHMEGIEKEKIFLWWFLEPPEQGPYLDQEPVSCETAD